MNISLFSVLQPTEGQPIEVVERKGVGHPDTLADGLAESISNAYAKYCQRECGAVLHHNFDKTMVSGGLFEAAFNESAMKHPATIIVNGHASGSYSGKPINVVGIVEPTAREYIGNVLPAADSEKEFKFLHLTSEFSHNPHWFHPRSLEVVPDHTRPHANDSSTFSSYWPLSRLEQTVLEVEGLFYHADSKPKYDYIGQDIKVLAVRQAQDISMVVCVPQIARLTPSHDTYVKRKNDIQALVMELVQRRLEGYSISVNINTADGTTGEKHYLNNSC